MHREPEVLEAEAQVGKWFDCRARITSKELAPLHSVTNAACGRYFVHEQTSQENSRTRCVSGSVRVSPMHDKLECGRKDHAQARIGLLVLEQATQCSFWSKQRKREDGTNKNMGT